MTPIFPDIATPLRTHIAEFGFSLLSRQARKVRNLRDRRRIPFTCERVGLRRVEAHGQIEGSLRRWQPVRLTVLAGALVLDLNVSGYHGKAVEAVRVARPASIISSARASSAGGTQPTS